VRIPDRLEPFAERIPAEIRKSLGPVDVIARCLASEAYEAKAAQARRDRVATLAKGYSALADEVLTAPAPVDDLTAEQLLALSKQWGVSPAMREGYRQRAYATAGTRLEDEFRDVAKALAGNGTRKGADSDLGLLIEKVLKERLG
jgi:hypothetical protein